MGMYAEVDILVTYETDELAFKVVDTLESNLEFFIKNNFPKAFVELDLVDLDGNNIIIKVSSSRIENAKWQSEQVFEFMKTTSGLIEFTANLLVPEEIIYWEADSE